MILPQTLEYSTPLTGNIADTHVSDSGLPHERHGDSTFLNPDGHCCVWSVMSRFATLIQSPPPQLHLVELVLINARIISEFVNQPPPFAPV